MLCGMKHSAIILTALLLLVSACDRQSAYDKCAESKAYLWNSDIKGNQYEGNEAYWDAVKTCKR